ncbi:MAG TPA: M56 family metallopeptidase [Thermoanaerobaculia bacterium]|jgi:beta-lactamase regulating signal transducer with metallopeptidase domain|nr:M56 family metallopeptidase [Thermoanaerobaculia bacterium]
MNGMITASVAWALVHFLWQGALVGLAAAGSLSLLKKSRAGVRYTVAVGFLFLMAALPVATAVRLASSPATTFAGPSLLGPTSPSSPGVGGVEGAGEEGRGDEGLSAAIPPPILLWVLGLWLAGVAILSVYHLGGLRVARRLSRQGRAPGERLEAMVSDLCRRLQIERAVILLESVAVSVPSVVGALRPILLVPASTLAGLSPRQLEAILAHELAHVRRHDYLVNLFQAAIETLLFYHPAVWWVSAQVRREREVCCDDLAVAICGDRLGYARALADLEGLRSAGSGLALAADGGSLADRIRRLVGAPARRSRRSWAAGLFALALLPAFLGIQLACSRTTVMRESRDVPTTEIAGGWSGELQGDQVRLEVKVRKGPLSHFTAVDSYAVSQLVGFTQGPSTHFELRLDSGTFSFQGSFEGGRGRGAVTFRPNPQFARNVGVPFTSSDLLELAVYDVPSGYAREMKDLGLVAYPRENLNGWEGFTRDLMGRREPPVERLIELRSHGVTPGFVRGMQAAGYADLGPGELIELYRHDVDPVWAKGIHETLYGPLPAFRLVELHDRDVTPEWLHGVVQVYPRVGADDVIALRVHGVDGDFIRAAQSRNRQMLTVPEILALHARGGIRS